MAQPRSPSRCRRSPSGPQHRSRASACLSSRRQLLAARHDRRDALCHSLDCQFARAAGHEQPSPRAHKGPCALSVVAATDAATSRLRSYPCPHSLLSPALLGAAPGPPAAGQRSSFFGGALSPFRAIDWRGAPLPRGLGGGAHAQQRRESAQPQPPRVTPTAQPQRRHCAAISQGRLYPVYAPFAYIRSRCLAKVKPQGRESGSTRRGVRRVK